MNEGMKRAKQVKGPSPMGSAQFKGTQGQGSSSNPTKGTMGSGKQGGSMAKGVMGKG